MNRRGTMIRNKKDTIEIDNIEEEIKDEEGKQNLEELIENLNTIEKNNFSLGLWKLKNKYFPKDVSSVPVGKNYYK